MTHATKIDGAWAPVYLGIPFVDGTGISRPGNWLELASDEERDEAEVYAVPEPDPPPSGKVEASRVLTGDDRPVWQVTYADAPAPPGPVVPESATNSDWRVGLILWGRFDEVEAKVIAARDSGTTEGKIVWQRWEYANDVFRAELMALHDTFGFTVEEVDESLIRARAVNDQTRAQAAAVLAGQQAAA